MIETTEPLAQRLQTDILWHRRRCNETIARDIEEAAAAIESQAQQIEALRADAERWRWLCATKMRPIYRPGHPKIEHYIDEQTIGWQDVKSAYTYKAGIDAAIDAAMAAKEPR
jgi:uncharacterized protein YdaU (DUF1376 family)